MVAAAYIFLFLSIIGCIAYGFIKWSKESTAPPVSDSEENHEKAAV